jgi:hypothetical protein
MLLQLYNAITKRADQWLTGTNGAAHVTNPQYTFTKYSAGGYTYIREAIMGTAKSAHLWRVLRVTDATGDMVYATGDDGVIGSFTCIGTDAGVVGLTYTLGA